MRFPAGDRDEKNIKKVPAGDTVRGEKNLKESSR